MSTRRVGLAVGALAAIAALSTAAFAAREPSPLTPPPPPGTGLANGACIRSHDIRNHTLADDETILMDVLGKGLYRITVDKACLAGATSSDPLVTRSPPGRTYICKPIDMDVSVSKAGFDSPCIVRSIVKLTPEEKAALPKRLVP